MPTYKHPCPYCGTFIERDVAACPACGRLDPFAPARCPVCSATLEDPTWVACPKCGAAIGVPPVSTAAGQAGGATPPAAIDTPTAAAPATASCSGCGSPLPAGARFCRDCGTVVA